MGGRKKTNSVPAACPYCYLYTPEVIIGNLEVIMFEIGRLNNTHSSMFYLKIVFCSSLKNKAWLIRIDQCPFCHRQLH